jgi:hypothetical protein
LTELFGWTEQEFLERPKRLGHPAHRLRAAGCATSPWRWAMRRRITPPSLRCSRAATTRRPLVREHVHWALEETRAAPRIPA